MALEWWVNGEDADGLETISDDLIDAWYQDGVLVNQQDPDIEPEEYLEQEIIAYIEARDSRPVHFDLMQYNAPDTGLPRIYFNYFDFNCGGHGG